MTKNVCPRCNEVVLCFGDEISIKCLKCETILPVKDESDVQDE